MGRRNFDDEFEIVPRREDAIGFCVRLALAEVAKNTMDEKTTAEEFAYQQHHPHLQGKEKLACRQKLAVAMEAITETAGHTQRAVKQVHDAADDAAAAIDGAGWIGRPADEVHLAQAMAAAAEVAADAACLVAERTSRLVWRAVTGPLLGIGPSQTGKYKYSATKTPTVPDDQNGRVHAALNALAKMEAAVPQCVELAALRTALATTAGRAQALSRAVATAADHHRQPKPQKTPSWSQPRSQPPPQHQPQPQSQQPSRRGRTPPLLARTKDVLHAASEGHRWRGLTCAEATAQVVVEVAATVQTAEHCTFLAASLLFAAECQRRGAGVHMETKLGTTVQASAEAAYAARAQSYNAVAAAQKQVEAVLASAKARAPFWARWMGRCRR